MAVTRRKTLAILGGAAVLGGGYSLATGLRSAITEMVERNFGSDIATTQDALEFIQDFIAQTNDRSTSLSLTVSGAHRLEAVRLPVNPYVIGHFERQVIESFVHSTNVAQVYPSAEEFYYSGLFSPYENPCTNQLSAAFLT